MSETIQARFIGEDGSLGYRHGRIYRLIVERDHPIYPVTIRRHLSFAGDCPYSSEEAFLRNWEVVDPTTEEER